MAFTVQPQNATAGVAFAPAVVVAIEDSLNHLVSGASYAVTVKIDTGVPGLSGTTTVTAVNGLATFGDLSIQRAGTGYFLTASSPGLVGAKSASFAIAPAAPSQLTFVAQPSTTDSGAVITPAVQVAIQDAFANPVPSASNAVAIAIGTNPSQGTLSGTTTEPAVGGVATFANLAIDQPGTGYTLAATARTLTGAASAGFNIRTTFIAATVSARGLNSCGVTPAGAAYCWGFGSNGQLGTGSSGAPQTCVLAFNPFTRPPRPITVGCSATPVAVAGGLAFVAVSPTCGFTTAGAAYCWGWGGNGELGDGTTTNSSVPVAVSGGLTFAALSPTCGVTTAGAAYCWGLNEVGELGDGTTINSPTPVAVAGGLAFVAVSAGGDNTCGLTPAGSVYCWGSNALGQLGNGTTTGPETCMSAPCSTTPVAVSGVLTFAAVSAGGDHACGLTPGHAAYCWGNNGALGNGATANSPTPVAVSGGLTFSTVSAGYGYTCGVTLAGAAYCWGSNGAGQLGNRTTSSSSTPVAVAGGLTFASVSAGSSHTCGVTTARAVYCWGNNRVGQLGDGTSGYYSYSSVPVRVIH